jgi:hypothetical protein
MESVIPMNGCLTVPSQTAELSMRLPDQNSGHSKRTGDASGEPCLAEAEKIRPGDPTPEEIQKRTAQVRQDWSESEHRRRAEITSQTKWVLTDSSILVRQYDGNDAGEAN